MMGLWPPGLFSSSNEDGVSLELSVIVIFVSEDANGLAWLGEMSFLKIHVAEISKLPSLLEDWTSRFSK
jgi:hypothetical protein